MILVDIVDVTCFMDMTTAAVVYTSPVMALICKQCTYVTPVIMITPVVMENLSPLTQLISKMPIYTVY